MDIVITYLKANVASIAATALDFAVTFCLVHFLGTGVVEGTATGAVAGGILNFSMGRNWVFGASEGRAGEQFLKYLLVWGGNAVLSTAGVYLLSKDMGLHYMLAKVLVAATMGLTYNYLLQKWFVFAPGKG
jgi:putative flippase GtrA